MGIVDWIAQLLEKPTCYGCPFLLTVGEFPEPEHAARQVIVRHKQRLRDRIETLARTAQLKHPQEFAGQLLIVIDGGFAERRYLEPSIVSSVFRRAAAVLIERYFRSKL